MNISTIFFDVDDTIYPAASGLWDEIRARIGLYMHERLRIPAAEVQPLRRKYFEEYGTTLRGLQTHYQFDVADFLAFVHDIPLEDYIHPDPAQQAVIKSISAHKFILTNADANHARRVLRVMQLDGCFEGIIDINQLSPYCKPMPEAFQIALARVGEPDAGKCVIIDDAIHTTRAAREQGMYSILFGATDHQASADAVLTNWVDLPGILNES